jgi:hypothetical protein
MDDLAVLAIALVFAISSWLLLALSDRLMGDKK